MRSTRCAACTRGSAGLRDERTPQRARPRDARRHRPVSRVHRLEDRPRPDGRHPRRRRLLVPGGCGRDHDGDGAADGVALAAAAAGPFDRRGLRLADPRVLRRLHGGADPADRGGRRRGADLRDVAPASRARRADRRLGAARACPRRLGDACARRRRLRARTRRVRRRRLPLDRARVRRRHRAAGRGRLLADSPEAARAHGAAAPPAEGRAAHPRRVRGRARVSRAHAAARSASSR